jgi:hypothetical protein
MVERLITSATRDELVFVAHRDSPFTPHKEINRNAARGFAKKRQLSVQLANVR